MPVCTTWFTGLSNGSHGLRMALTCCVQSSKVAQHEAPLAQTAMRGRVQGWFLLGLGLLCFLKNFKISLSPLDLTLTGARQWSHGRLCWTERMRCAALGKWASEVPIRFASLRGHRALNSDLCIATCKTPYWKTLHCLHYRCLSEVWLKTDGGHGSQKPHWHSICMPLRYFSRRKLGTPYGSMWQPFFLDSWYTLPGFSIVNSALWIDTNFDVAKLHEQGRMARNMHNSHSVALMAQHALADEGRTSLVHSVFNSCQSRSAWTCALPCSQIGCSRIGTGDLDGNSKISIGCSYLRELDLSGTDSHSSTRVLPHLCCFPEGNAGILSSGRISQGIPSQACGSTWHERRLVKYVVTTDMLVQWKLASERGTLTRAANFSNPYVCLGKTAAGVHSGPGWRPAYAQSMCRHACPGALSKIAVGQIQLDGNVHPLCTVLLADIDRLIVRWPSECHCRTGMVSWGVAYPRMCICSDFAAFSASGPDKQPHSILCIYTDTSASMDRMLCLLVQCTYASQHQALTCPGTHFLQGICTGATFVVPSSGLAQLVACVDLLSFGRSPQQYRSPPYAWHMCGTLVLSLTRVAAAMYPCLPSGARGHLAYMILTPKELCLRYACDRQLAWNLPLPVPHVRSALQDRDGSTLVKPQLRRQAALRLWHRSALLHCSVERLRSLLSTDGQRDSAHWPGKWVNCPNGSGSCCTDAPRGVAERYKNFVLCALCLPSWCQCCDWRNLRSVQTRELPDTHTLDVIPSVSLVQCNCSGLIAWLEPAPEPMKRCGLWLPFVLQALGLPVTGPLQLQTLWCLSDLAVVDLLREHGPHRPGQPSTASLQPVSGLRRLAQQWRPRRVPRVANPVMTALLRKRSLLRWDQVRARPLTHTGCQLDRPRLWDGVLMSLPVDHRRLADLFRQFRYSSKPCLDTACAARRSIRMHHTMHRMLSSQFFRSERPHATLLHSKHELRMSWLSGPEALCLHIDSARPGPKSGRRPPATGRASLDRGMSGVRVTGGAGPPVGAASRSCCLTYNAKQVTGIRRANAPFIPLIPVHSRLIRTLRFLRYASLFLNLDESMPAQHTYLPSHYTSQVATSSKRRCRWQTCAEPCVPRNICTDDLDSFHALTHNFIQRQSSSLSAHGIFLIWTCPQAYQASLAQPSIPCKYKLWGLLRSLFPTDHSWPDKKKFWRRWRIRCSMTFSRRRRNLRRFRRYKGSFYCLALSIVLRKLLARHAAYNAWVDRVTLTWLQITQSAIWHSCVSSARPEVPLRAGPRSPILSTHSNVPARRWLMCCILVHHVLLADAAGITASTNNVQREVGKKSYIRACARAMRDGVTTYRGRPLYISEVPQQASTLVHAHSATRRFKPRVTPAQGGRLKIFSWNCAGLGQVHDELLHWVTVRGYDIVILQETLWKFSNTWVNENYVFVHSGWNKKGKSECGLLVLISKKLVREKDVRFQEIIPGRLLRVHSATTVGTHTLDVIAAYQHVWRDDQNTINQRADFWTQLSSALHEVAARSFLVLAGDFNVTCRTAGRHVGCGVPKKPHPAGDWQDWMAILEAHALVALNKHFWVRSVLHL